MTDPSVPAPPASASPQQPPPPAVGSTPVTPPPYAGSSRASISLHRTLALERAAVALVGVAAVFALLRVVVARQVRGDARSYLDGALHRDELMEAIAPAALVIFVHLLAVLAAAIVVIIWMYRIADNHRLLQRPTRWSPGWAIGGWFLPPLLYIIPTMMLVELWQSADPDAPTSPPTPSASSDDRRPAISPLIPIWFVLYSVAPIVLTLLPGRGPITALAGSEDQLARSFTQSQTINDLGSIVTAAAAVVFALMARSIGERHRRLTGENRS